MLQELITLLDTLSKMSPLAIIGLLATIVWMLVKNQKQTETIHAGQEKIATNHLHGLPDMAATLERIEKAISEQTREQRVNSQTIRELLVHITARLEQR